MSDIVNHPSHYSNGRIECIDAMHDMMDKSEISEQAAYLWGNLFKYIWRWPAKNGLEDLQKAEWYLKKLMEDISNKN
jgi:hypothetical protein